MDLLGPRGDRPPPGLRDHRRAVVEAAPVVLHDRLRAVRKRGGADVVGDHRARRLLGLVAAYRLAARVIGEPRWAAATAGVLAAGGIVVTQEWFYYMFRGTSEPMLIACALWAIDRHLERRYAWAFVLGVAPGLMRPEAWPLLIVYA